MRASRTARLLIVGQAPGAGLDMVRAVDWEGAIRVRRSRAMVLASTAGEAQKSIAQLWAETTRDTEGAVPGLFLMYQRHLVDLSGVETREQALALAISELDGVADDVAVALIAVPPGQVV